MNNKKLYCMNCSKISHLTKNCPEPIFSYGIICIKFDESIKILPGSFEQFLVNKLIDIEEYNFSNLTHLSKIDYYKNKIKFLMIQRKHSFSYIEFMRGKYDENSKESISNLLNLMTKTEIDYLLNNNFNYLWTELWKKTSTYKSYQKEFEIAEYKFNKIKSKLINYINYDILYDTPEWGFPKGRKDKNEKSLDCAIREFEEETGINQSNFILLNRLNTIDETVIGTQNKLYKLVYYLALINNNDIKLDMTNEYQEREIGDIKWLTFEELLPKIRPYFKEKITMIYKIYFLFINLIENMNNSKSSFLSY